MLGKRVLSDLKPSDVRRLHRAIFARNVGPSSVAGAHRTLSAMLGYAVDEGVIVRNVAESVTIPRQAPAARGSRKSHPSTAAAARAVAKYAGGCPKRILDIALNLEAEPFEGRWALVRPESHKPHIVPLTTGVSAAMQTYLDADTGPNPHRLVWHRSDGKPLSNGRSNAAFRDALARAGITRDAATHWLRHTYTTMAEHAGIPWVVYAGISGHGSEDISRRYTHQLEQQARDGVQRLDGYLRGL